MTITTIGRSARQRVLFVARGGQLAGSKTGTNLVLLEPDE
jgi:hypothetical protein